MIYAYYILNKLDWYEYKQSVLFLKTKIQANIRLSMIKAKRANLDQILVKKYISHYGSITLPSVCLF